MRSSRIRRILAVCVAVLATFLVVSGAYTNFGKPFIREFNNERVVIAQFHWPSLDMGPKSCDLYELYPDVEAQTSGKDTFATVSQGRGIRVALLRADKNDSMQIVESIDFIDALGLISALNIPGAEWDKVAAKAFVAKKREMNVEKFTRPLR